MEFRARPFDAATVLANARRKRTRRPRGRNSPLYTSVRPLVQVARLFGFVPYEFSPQGRLAPSNAYPILSAIAAALYSYILYMVLQRFTSVKRERPVLGGTEYAKVIVNYSVVMYELGLAVFRRRSFVTIWNALQDYDEDVRQLGHPREERRTTIVAWILAVATAIVWTAVNRSGMHAFSETWIYNTGYLLPYVGASIAVYKFAAMALFLGQRFRHLNAIAARNLPSTTACRRTAAVSKETIQSLHNELMLAAENLGSLYSWSLLFWLGNLSLHTVSDVYFIIEWILVKSWDTTAWPLIRCLSIWLLAFLSQLLLLHVACDFASSQAGCMGAILIEWQVRLTRKSEERIESSWQYLNRRLNFSAGGCFYVNLPLLRSIASLLTTYLVILLQLPD